MQELTDRQMRILDCISAWIKEKGFPPSVREISTETGIRSTRGVTLNLDALEHMGHLHRDATARSIRLTPPHLTMKARMLPLMGAIAAGPPLLANGHIEEIIPVPEALAPENEDDIVLRVRGDSMLGEGIHDGDMVIVRRQPVAENGELAAVMIDGEATIKRFFRDGPDRVRLEPSNPEYKPILVSLRDSQTMIVGKVVGLLRSYR